MRTLLVLALRHDFTIALRRIASQRLYSALGVAVLTLGIVCFIATHLFVSYIGSYDRNFANADRTYAIEQTFRAESSGLDMRLMIQSALPLAEYLRLDVPELAAVSRYRSNLTPVEAGGRSMGRAVAYVEAPFYDIFDFKSVGGDLRAATAPRSAVLTRHAAQQMFGEGDAVGKIITIGGAHPLDVEVVAVIEDVPAASHLASGSLFSRGFDVLASWDVFEAIGRTPFDTSWGNAPVMTYALLPPDGSFTAAELNGRLRRLVARHIPAEWRQAATIEFEARPIASIAASTLQWRYQGYGPPWRVDVLRAVSIFAAAILAIACLNFVNLATAQTSGRALAIATRKALGAKSAHVVRQELIQTALIVAAATALALAAIVPAGRLLTGAWRVAFAVPWAEPRFWTFLAALLAGVTCAVGLYPALVLARIRPAAGLRLGAVRSGPRLVRTVLVGAQFATASFLVAVVVVLLVQRHGLREALLGRFEDPYVMFYVGPPAPMPDREVLARELSRGPNIEGASFMWQPLLQATGPRTQLRRAADAQAPRLTMDAQAVGYDFFALLDIPVLAGRVFERGHADDAMPRTPEAIAAREGGPVAMVLDRAAARALGWPDPAGAVGQTVYASNSTRPIEIIGVVETVPMTIRTRGSAGLAYEMDPTISDYWIVRLGKGDVAASLAHIRDAVEKLAPGRGAPRLAFLDQAFASAYWTFAVMNRVLGGLALFAIAIAGTGLFGMASYVTARRTREIGLRKTQGASSGRVLRMLLWDFSKPVVAANLAAWPLAFYAAERYLGLFAERAALTPLPFALALAATLALAWLTVGGRVLHAARLSPAVSLRNE
ncbi:MAG TPA: ABC transporter permease [Gammaproteobacteria bacterium]|nr:ABC transporter permease [Gammaproteobacteria bacterium]